MLLHFLTKHLNNNKGFVGKDNFFLSVVLIIETTFAFGGSKIAIGFEICNPTEQLLNAKTKIGINLNETIPGFAHGLQGMKCGEKRVLYIHPALAYGIYTYLEKGIYLKATVTLHKIYDEIDPLSPLIPLDLSFLRTTAFQKECEDQHIRALHFMGAKKHQFLQLLSWFRSQNHCKTFNIFGISIIVKAPSNL